MDGLELRILGTQWLTGGQRWMDMLKLFPTPSLKDLMTQAPVLRSATSTPAISTPGGPLDRCLGTGKNLSEKSKNSRPGFANTC